MARNPWERVNRLRKAVRILHVLDESLGRPVTPAVLRELPDESWKMAAVIAGTRPGSELTREKVIEIARERAGQVTT